MIFISSWIKLQTSISNVLTWVDPPPLQAIGLDEAPPYISSLFELPSNVTLPVLALLPNSFKKDWQFIVVEFYSFFIKVQITKISNLIFALPAGYCLFDRIPQNWDLDLTEEANHLHHHNHLWQALDLWLDYKVLLMIGDGLRQLGAHQRLHPRPYMIIIRK